MVVKELFGSQEVELGEVVAAFVMAGQSYDLGPEAGHRESALLVP